MTAVALGAPSRRWGTRLRRWFGALFAARTEVDPGVLARARAGDHRAFAVIVAHYDEQLRGLAFRLLGDRTAMDDVLQEAYVKAFVALPKFKGDAGLGTWLFRITYNACVDELRKRRPVDPMLEDVPAATAPQDLAVARHDLDVALRTLPADQRAAVMLVDAYGFDYAAAAEVLGVREGTIGSRLTRARAALRHALGNDA